MRLHLLLILNSLSCSVGLRIHSVQLFSNDSAPEGLDVASWKEASFWRSEETGSMESILASVDAQTRSEMMNALESGVDAESVQQMWSYPFPSIVKSSKSKCSWCGSLLCRDPTLTICAGPGPFIFGAPPTTPCTCLVIFPYSFLAADLDKSELLNLMKGFGPAAKFAATAVQKAYSTVLGTVLNRLVCSFDLGKMLIKKAREAYWDTKGGPAKPLPEGLTVGAAKNSKNKDWLKAVLPLPIPLFTPLRDGETVKAIFKAAANAAITSTAEAAHVGVQKGLVAGVQNLAKKGPEYIFCKVAITLLYKKSGNKFKMSNYVPGPLKKSPMVCYIDNTCGGVIRNFIMALCKEKLFKALIGAAVGLWSLIPASCWKVCKSLSIYCLKSSERCKQATMPVLQAPVEEALAKMAKMAMHFAFGCGSIDYTKYMTGWDGAWSMKDGYFGIKDGYFGKGEMIVGKL